MHWPTILQMKKKSCFQQQFLVMKKSCMWARILRMKKNHVRYHNLTCEKIMHSPTIVQTKNHAFTNNCANKKSRIHQQIGKWNKNKNALTNKFSNGKSCHNFINGENHASTNNFANEKIMHWPSPWMTQFAITNVT